MNPHYKEPVVVFGLIVPLVLVFAVLGLGLHFRGKLESTYKERQASYNSYKRVEAQRKGLQAQIREQEPHMNRWMALFEKPALPITPRGALAPKWVSSKIDEVPE